mgnify:FL=1
MAVRMQELVNMVLEIADSIDSSEYIRKEELRQKAHDLDAYLLLYRRKKSMQT